MKTKVSIGIAAASDGYRTGTAVAEMAMSTFDGLQPTLALLFVSHAQPENVLEGVYTILKDVPLIGATSAGEYSQDGYVEDGAGLFLLHSETIRFLPISYHPSWFRFGKRLLGTLSGLSEQGLGSSYRHRGLMLFPDDRSMNLDDVVERAMTETGMLYDIIGGPSPTIPAPPREPAIFINNKVIKNGMVGAEVLSKHPIGLSLANGWQPVSGPYRVTSVDKRTVVRIDGRAARDVYEDFLHEKGILIDKLEPELLLQHPIGICEEGDCKVSVIMGVDQRGALQVTSPPPRNAIIHILGTQPDAMTTAAHRAVSNAMQKTESAAGLLFIDCMSTGMVLEDVYNQQRLAVAEAVGDVPFLGFRSHGVLARLQGQTNGHYECSVGTWVVPQ